MLISSRMDESCWNSCWKGSHLNGALWCKVSALKNHFWWNGKKTETKVEFKCEAISISTISFIKRWKRFRSMIWGKTKEEAKTSGTPERAKYWVMMMLLAEKFLLELCIIFSFLASNRFTIKCTLCFILKVRTNSEEITFLHQLWEFENRDWSLKGGN